MYKSLFPYFGSKSKLAHLYPKPEYRLIVEPFAGSAAYSLLYSNDASQHEVWLNDTYIPTANIWKWLQTKDALSLIRSRIPWNIEPGTSVSTLYQDSDPEGFISLLRAYAGQGAFGMGGKNTTGPGGRDKVSPYSAVAWRTVRRKLEYWVPRIKHWKITTLDYHECMLEVGKKATWYIDPPYQNAAGATYAKSSKELDFVKLADWCKACPGQKIVCENAGANWLPFEMLTERRRGIYCDAVQSTVGEVMWYEYHDDVGLWA